MFQAQLQVRVHIIVNQVVVVWTYNASEGVKAERHLRYVSAFEQIGSLENLFFRYTVFFDGRLKSTK